jgi:hypothetical protein
MPPSRPPRYIADVVADLRSPRAAAHDGWQARLLFKKRMFRETDEAVSEPQFINLSYIQVGPLLVRVPPDSLRRNGGS